MPRRGYIDPEGYYHVGSRGVYGKTLFANKVEHEAFLLMFTRVALKYGLRTLTWALMKNHHHFILRLTDGGLSEAMRELHGGYSRWRHEVYGQTRMGHLVRHAFFARELEDDEDVVRACVYVDLNPAAKRISCRPRRGDWSGYASTLGLSHPRPFHSPSDLLELLDAKARRGPLVVSAPGREGARVPEVTAPDHVTELRRARMVESHS